MKNGRYNIYINEIRAKKFDRVFKHLQSIGVIGAGEQPSKHLALIVDFALNMAIEEIKYDEKK